MKLLVDNPESISLDSGHIIHGNSFERVFAPWPLRFYVIINSKIVSTIFLLDTFLTSFLAAIELDL